MGAEQSEETISELAANWEVGSDFDDVTTELESYFAGIADGVEPLLQRTRKAFEFYHTKFAAEITADLVKTQELDVVQVAESDDDGVVDGFQVSVIHMVGTFGVPTEMFDTTSEALSDLLENWAREAGPLYRKNGAAYLHKLADRLAEKVTS